MLVSKYYNFSFLSFFLFFLFREYPYAFISVWHSFNMSVIQYALYSTRLQFNMLTIWYAFIPVWYLFDIPVIQYVCNNSTSSIQYAYNLVRIYFSMIFIRYSQAFISVAYYADHLLVKIADLAAIFFFFATFFPFHSFWVQCVSEKNIFAVNFRIRTEPNKKRIPDL